MNTVKDKILKLKKEKNAIILAHFYTPDETQEIADYVGDSFYLAKISQKTDADILVFCGVSFMGESAKIINPEKKVLMPDLSADCPMAHMADIEKIKSLRAEYEDLAVVCYINSTATLKANSDICVTSSNALEIVRRLPNKNIFFIPDKNLGRFVKEMLPEKNIILNDGCCPIHANIKKEEVLKQKKLHPEALILAHPECEKEVCDMADFLGSTLDIINYANDSSQKEFIILTEEGVLYELKKNNPHKEFYFIDKKPVCPDMKLNNLTNILSVLEKENNEVTLKNDLRESAIKPLERMLEF